jgi:chitodextrinase
VDGVLENSVPHTYAGDFADATHEVNIGYLNLGAGLPFRRPPGRSGRLQPGALGRGELRTHYNGGSGRFTTPVAIMPLGASITKGEGTCQEPDEYYNCVGYRGPLWEMLTEDGYFVDFVGDQGGYYQSQYLYDNNHLGYGGWSDDEIAGIIYDRLETFQADVLLVHIGTNAASPDPGQIADLLDEVDRYEYTYGKAVTVVLPQLINKIGETETIMAFNANVVAMATARIDGTDGGTPIPGTSPVQYYRAPGVPDKIRLVDMFSAVPDENIPDGTHPDADGYDIMAQVWYDELIQLLDQISDTTPPSTPGGLAAAAQSEFAIALSWDPAEDLDSGVSHYNVYRDGIYVGSTAGTTYVDEGLRSSTTYDYQVSAANGIDLEGGRSAAVAEATLADATAPTIASVGAAGAENVIVVFSEPVDEASAETAANYGLDNGVSVLGAVLAGDGKSVLLTVSSLSTGVAYTLTVTGVQDLAAAPNTVSDAAGFEYDEGNRVGDGLVVLYDFKTGSGTSVPDVSGAGAPMDLTISGDVAWSGSGNGVVMNTGAGDGIIQTAASGAKVIGALQATGQCSFEAWVQPDNLTQRGPARIIAISPDATDQNYVLGQQEDDLQVRLQHTGKDDNDARPRLETTDNGLTTALTHIVHTFDGTTERLYVERRAQAGDRRRDPATSPDGTAFVCVQDRQRVRQPRRAHPALCGHGPNGRGL